MIASDPNPVEGTDVTLTCQSLKLPNTPRWFVSFTDDRTNELEIDPNDPLISGNSLQLGSFMLLYY